MSGAKSPKPEPSTITGTITGDNHRRRVADAIDRRRHLGPTWYVTAVREARVYMKASRRQPWSAAVESFVDDHGCICDACVTWGLWYSHQDKTD